MLSRHLLSNLCLYFVLTAHVIYKIRAADSPREVVPQERPHVQPRHVRAGHGRRRHHGRHDRPVMRPAARTRWPVPSSSATGSVPVAVRPLGRRRRRVGQRQRVVGRSHGSGRRGRLVKPGQHRLEAAGKPLKMRVEPQHPVGGGLVTRVGRGESPVVGIVVRGRGRRGRVEGWGLRDRSRGENGGGKFKHSTHKSVLSHYTVPRCCQFLQLGCRSESY